MPLKKIENEPWPGFRRRECRHPDHDPPTMIVLPTGTYEHICPGCEATSTFTVRGTYMSMRPTL